MKLLVVDDDLHIRRLVGIYLREAGHDVTEASTGEEALRAAHEQAFDVVLIDLILPHYGGYRLCENLKSLPSPPRIVLTTGDDSTQTRQRVAEANADAFLPKPFTREELLAAVSSSA